MRYCQHLVVNEYFESRARKLAKRRFFQTFVLETIEPLSCKQLKFPGNFNCLQHSGHERKVIQYHCLPKIKQEVSYAGMTKKKFTLSPYQHYLTPLMLKLCRKSVDLSPKSFLWMSTQPFTIYLQCLPRGDPGSLCANTRIRLLATHSFGFNHELPTLQILGPSRVKQKPFAILFWITDSFLVWYPLTRYRLSSEP